MHMGPLSHQSPARDWFIGNTSPGAVWTGGQWDSVDSGTVS